MRWCISIWEEVGAHVGESRASWLTVVDWRLPPDGRADPTRYATYVQILGWFMDDPSAACPFSVHRMALVGKQLGKGVGEWFGPSTAAGALK